jgi:hypothetical protein
LQALAGKNNKAARFEFSVELVGSACRKVLAVADDKDLHEKSARHRDGRAAAHHAMVARRGAFVSAWAAIGADMDKLVLSPLGKISAGRSCGPSRRRLYVTHIA